MKKMNKMYEAPMAEVVELNLNKDFMQGGWHAGSAQLGPEEDL
jgi:hypothetical protein